jgi:hypothetical protein
MGHGLQRISRSRRGKLPIIIPEGHIRPLTPVISAKFATECNIAVRDHVPILKHWKEYKKIRSVIDTYLGSLCGCTFSRPLPHFHDNLEMKNLAIFSTYYMCAYFSEMVVIFMMVIII